MHPLDRTATSLFGANWRTTLASIVSAISAFIVLNPEFVHNQFVLKLAEFVGLGGLAAIVINAKDKQVKNRDL